MLIKGPIDATTLSFLMSYKGITPTVEIIYAPEMESRKLAALTINQMLQGNGLSPKNKQQRNQQESDEKIH